MSPYSLLATTVRISAADIFVSASPRHQARINVDVPLGVSRGTRKRRKSRFYWVSCRFQLGKTLRLEQGDWVKSSDFPTHGRNWEARRYSDFDISPNRRARDTDYPVNDDNSVMKVANFNGVGGGTILYTAHFPRMHPSDFHVRTLDGVADNWPIDYWTLEPYFAENDRMMGVAGLAGDPAYPAHEPTMPPVPLGRSGTRYARALNKLGWHWWPSDISVATTDYDGRARCINLGHCTPGSRKGQKQVSTSPIGLAPSGPGWSCAAAAACGRSRPTSTVWPPARSITIQAGWSGSSRPKS